MKKRKLGQQGLEVSSLGLGCMGLTWAYGPTDDAESLKVLHRTIELGINFWDTAEMYGPYTNEALIGTALKTIPRKDVIIATKFGFVWNEKNEVTGLNSKPAHIIQSIEGSLKRLNTDYIDLYYQHRLDPETPIEDTIGTLADLVKQGKVRYIGLSEVGPKTIRRAHAVHPITALQSEYSLWDRGIEEKVLPVVRELKIGFVPFSPLGRGFLTGKVTGLNTLDSSDFRQNLARFQAGNFEHNIQLVNTIQEISKEYQSTPAQIALAWLLRQGEDIVPIPGTKKLPYLEENAGAVNLELPASAWSAIDQLLASFEIKGVRYPEAILKMGDTE